MTQRTKVKVLVLRGGGGHYATYLAIHEILAREQPSWQVEPLFADRLGAEVGAKTARAETDSEKSRKISQLLSTGSDRFYDFILKNGLGWIHLLTVHIHKLITLMKHRLDVHLLTQTWQQDPPDIVLSVVPFQNRALAESLQLAFPHVPVVTVLTDFADSPPAYWMAPSTHNYVLCPSEKAVAQALSAGVHVDRVIATSGLIIHPQFYPEQFCPEQLYSKQLYSEPPHSEQFSESTAPNRSDRRQLLGLAPERMTGLVMFGANGSNVMLQIAEKLAALGDLIQLIFICGRNHKVAEALLATQSIRQKRVVIGFTSDIPDYMQLADFFIGKPGNVSVSEAISMNLPTIVERNWLTLTQEKYAADWLKENQVGISVRSFKGILQAVETMIEPENFARYKEKLQQLENRAVFELPQVLERILEKARSEHGLAGSSASRNFIIREASNEQERPLIKSAVGLYEFSPQAIAQPKTEQDLLDIVQYAREKNLRVKAIGARHSAVPLPATEGLCVSLDQYKKVLQVDGLLVTVQSGIRLCELNDFLAQHGLALPVLGTIALQTVAGAISTGTHGGSLHHTSLSGYVEAMRIVRSDGTVAQIHKEDEEFGGVAIALGSLGLISTITFRCVPAFSLGTSVITLPMTSFLDRFDALNRQNQYVDIRYSPITDKAHLALINPTTEPLSENGGWEPPDNNAWVQGATNRINKLAQQLFLTHKFNWLQRWGLERYDRCIYTEAYGRSDFVLTHFDATSTDLLANEDRSNLDPVADMEVAVPYSKAVDAISVLRQHFQSTQRFPSMHIHIRCQAADSAWLSPTRGEDICWIEFWEYPCTGKFFAEMMALLEPFEPVGHWGKQLPGKHLLASSKSQRQHRLQHQYPQWDSFIQLRREWDPDGMFANDYLDDVLPLCRDPFALTDSVFLDCFSSTPFF